eukprot:RCo003960
MNEPHLDSRLQQYEDLVRRMSAVSTSEESSVAPAVERQPLTVEELERELAVAREEIQQKTADVVRAVEMGQLLLARCEELQTEMDERLNHKDDEMITMQFHLEELQKENERIIELLQWYARQSTAQKAEQLLLQEHLAAQRKQIVQQEESYLQLLESTVKPLRTRIVDLEQQVSQGQPEDGDYSTKQWEDLLPDRKQPRPQPQALESRSAESDPEAFRQQPHAQFPRTVSEFAMQGEVESLRAKVLQQKQALEEASRREEALTKLLEEDQRRAQKQEQELALVKAELDSVQLMGGGPSPPPGIGVLVSGVEEPPSTGEGSTATISRGSPINPCVSFEECKKQFPVTHHLSIAFRSSFGNSSFLAGEEDAEAHSGTHEEPLPVAPSLAGE